MIGRILLTLGTLLPLAIGCADPRDLTELPPADIVGPGLVVAKLSAHELRAAQGIEVVFTNASSTHLGVNACERRVDRLVDGQWVSYPEELRLCTSELSLLPAQGSLTTVTDVPNDAVPGQHRFRFNVRATAAPVESSEVIATFSVR